MDFIKTLIMIMYCLKYTTAILHLTDSNGGTLFEDGTLVDCKANRLIFFDGNTLHASMHQTNIKSRYTANFNFILTPESNENN